MLKNACPKYVLIRLDDDDKMVPEKSQKTENNRILGGVDANDIRDAPWQVSIRSSSTLCGGSIIDATHIVSAGHCFYTPGGPPDPQAVRVFAGQVLLYSGTAHKVKSVKLHPQYDPVTYANDISVLELELPLDNGTAAGAVCLPEQPLEQYMSQKAMVSGFGIRKVDVLEASPKLQILTGVQIQASCNNINVSAGAFCAGGEKDKDACQGDSGGPLVVNGTADCNTATLVGVISWGNSCGAEGVSGAYTDVGYFLREAGGWLCMALGLDPCPNGESS